MIYYKKKDDKIDKYDVYKDSKELSRLKKIIIDNCSEITHVKEYNVINVPNKKGDLFEIRNLEKKLIDKPEFDSVRYDLEYDVYSYPYLIRIIDGLLSGNSDMMKYLYQDFSREIVPINEQISTICDRIMEVKDEEEIEKLKLRLKDLEKIKDLNINQKDPLIYYFKVQDCIELKHIGSIDISAIIKAYDFFDEDEELMLNEIKNSQKVKKIK